MPTIEVLPQLLVNKIAAGEVIERPASVVKELVENSLDAGASRIEVAIEDGGRKLIRVVDDGVGMDAEDLARCIQPHATSKIRKEDDLFQIATMGFRGEALPSIGSVSQLSIVSRQHDADQAHQIHMAGPVLEPVTAAAGPPGTTIEIREVFFNVPARQKFLRTAQTEMGHITEQIARVALARPEVEFRLTHNGRMVHHLRPSESMRSRIADLYGRELSDGLMEFSRTERGVSLRGFAAPPADSRSSNKWQYFFLNGRFIRDRFIAHAVREAYRGLIEPSRHPVVFLAIDVPPDSVDVNVHPTKIEVRWRDSNMLYSQVLSALRDRFLNADLSPKLIADRPSPTRWQAAPAPAGGMTDVSSDLSDERARRARESIASYLKSLKPRTADQPPAFGGSVPSASFTAPSTSDSTPRREDFGFTSPPPGGVMQIHRSYLAAETDEGLVIVDQHALHERILFEKLSAEITQGPLESQRLLIPETIDASSDQVAVLETHAEVIAQLGFEFSAAGPQSIAIHAVPSLLKPERVTEFVRDLLDRAAATDEPASAEMLTNDILSMMACKAAVKAGDPLTPEEMQALMAQRDLVERSSNCPHGRPTTLRFTLGDLEKQFKRT